MSADAVLVSFTLEGHYKTYETSGILFNPNLVLLTGTALIPVVKQENWISLFVNSCSSKLEPNSYLQRIYFRVFVEREKNPGKSSPGPASFEGTPLGAWKCPLVSASTRALFRDWTVGHASVDEASERPSEDDVDTSKELASVFVLLGCGRGRGRANGPGDDHVRTLADVLPGLGSPSRGQEVEVVSTPCGHRHFLNSVSRGVVSNAVGRQGCIILSDARTVSGCEGGPIFAGKKSRKEREKGDLLGMVTCPLTWWRGEWVGLTMGVSLLPVLKKLLRPEENPAASVRTTPDGPSPDSLPFKFIDESVVLVRGADSWGSGVVLHGTSATVITCAHVVKDDETVSVYHKGNQWSASVIFRSKNDVAYDLAVIKIRHSHGFARGAKFSEKPAKLGETVIAAGFPFFSERDDACIRASIVTGCISKVNPYMIQTTCCIQSGFSGGPLFRDGELLGVIISNTIGSGALFPHINFIAPSSVFKEPILKYIRTNDIRCLQDLESSNSEAQSLWKLHTSKL